MVNGEVEVAVVDDSFGIIFVVKGNKELENYLEETWGQVRIFTSAFKAGAEFMSQSRSCPFAAVVLGHSSIIAPFTWPFI